jgi:perosamine synthetase
MSDSKLALHGGQPTMAMPHRKSTIGQEERIRVLKVIENGTLSGFRGGEQVRQFERAFANFVGAKYALATTSGTTALHTCVAALNLQPDDEVLVPAVTFVSTASVVMQEKAKVVFVDIDENYCIEIDDLKSKITEHTRAIIPVHLYGRAANMDAIMGLAQEHNLTVIEDACQAHGALYEGHRSGNLGTAGCFSFFETKNMTCGEGGMITTSDEAYYEQLCLRREHGSQRGVGTWYNYEVLGYNYNMTELQGAIGQAQLQKLDIMNQARIDNAKHYGMELKGLGLTLPTAAYDGSNVYHNYPILLPDELATRRAFFVDAVRAEGVPIDIAYPCTLYQTELFKKAGVDGNCPRAEGITSRLFTLFTDAAIDEEVIANTAVAIKKVLRHMAMKND